MPDEYVAPECRWDFPAAYRAEILSDVMLHGEAERCPTDLSNAFAGWGHSQIVEWCTEHNLSIVARYDGRIVVYRSITVSRALIRAEVEAMDWPEVIGE